MSSENKKLLRISPSDNVLITTCALDAGTVIDIEGDQIQLDEPIALGYKIAAHNLKNGEKIIKYGVSIGSATSEIKRGEVVHLHNMKSDYLPTYSRGKDTYE